MSEIINYYNQFDEWGRLEREPIEFKVNWHYIKKYLPKTGKILDNGAGPGKYSMELAKEGYNVTLADLTPRLVEIAKIKACDLNLSKQFNDFLVADARELKMFDDEQFDASLMLGPMYHLQDEIGRIKAADELNRVTKKGGLVFVAFMPRIRHILTSLLSPENWKPNNSLEAINSFSESGCFNHTDKGRFTGAYYFEIDDIKPFMESQGFECLQLLGSNVGTILTKDSWDYWNENGQENQLIELIIEKATDPYILGISSHLLYIGRKK
ncbi:class I SAM-dependent methyltransferase [Ureibacillus aquaedulcis]|uniref:Class I SAM-dependent methyltransferase n=1 Tax=Ureibacillus aquaedulcis TaxID=3058421 RepID=A0ABT8GMJ0_9BACL|nr:class I SAM-dependent methyltransferase [Ureibacillus sp. BA0131]MDN4492624.1 class I SAM-dependent methyltransferase [Ureibacillus sp. BA0131]